MAIIVYIQWNTIYLQYKSKALFVMDGIRGCDGKWSSSEGDKIILHTCGIKWMNK